MQNKKELLFKFKEHLKVLNRSSATINGYTYHVEKFLHTVEIDDIRQITTRMLEDYIAGLYKCKTKENKPFQLDTIIIKVRSIKRFFEFLERANIIFINPAEFVYEPRKQRGRIKNILTFKEAKKILEQPNLGTRTGIRDRTILEVFYSTGIRLNELCLLTIYDADLQGKMIRVKGKGQKDRVVPVGKHAIRFMKEYITKVRPHFTKKNRTNRYLFVDRYGNPISSQVVGIMIRTYARAAKMKKQVSAHTFRHSFATSLMKNKADVVAVQKMLGHADLRTTQMYVRSLGMNIKSVHKKTHPREKDKEDTNTIKPQIERKI